MKKIFALCALIALMVTGCFTPALHAQEDVMKQAMEGYKTLTSLTAKVTKTVHNEMVAKDQITTGMLYFKKPAKVCITTNGGQDKLLTDGETFTIVQNGKASTATGKGNTALTPLVTAIKGITSGNADMDLSDVADVDMEREGNLMIMTITPIVKGAAERKKMLYQSFVVTVDQKAGELRSIRLNGKGKNYDKYEFSDFKMDAKFSDSVFAK